MKVYAKPDIILRTTSIICKIQCWCISLTFSAFNHNHHHCCTLSKAFLNINTATHRRQIPVSAAQSCDLDINFQTQPPIHLLCKVQEFVCCNTTASEHYPYPSNIQIQCKSNTKYFPQSVWICQSLHITNTKLKKETQWIESRFCRINHLQHPLWQQTLTFLNCFLCTVQWCREPKPEKVFSITVFLVQKVFERGKENSKFLEWFYIFRKKKHNWDFRQI